MAKIDNGKNFDHFNKHKYRAFYSIRMRIKSMEVMNKNNQNVAILLAVLAAALYAISTPVSKVMLQVVPPTMVAPFLYLGAGIGVGTMMLIRYERKRPSSEQPRPAPTTP